MEIEYVKKLAKARLAQLGYDKDYNHNVSVDLGDGNLFTLPHTRNDILSLQFSVDVAENDEVPLEGGIIPIAFANKLVALGKRINVDLYNELWQKYGLVDDALTSDETDAVLWTYDIKQVYVLS